MEKSFGNIVFSSKFDSGNLARVEEASIEEDSDKIYVFNIWTRLDCEGTIYENSNRSWFYFSVTGVPIGSMVQFNIMNLNRHGKLFGQGFAPVTRTIPGKLGWERVSSRVVYDFISSETKILTFHHKFTAALKSFTYFAFTYPWSYEKCQTQLEKLDRKYANCKLGEIYYYRELLCLSKGGNRIDLITISNFSKLTECEDRIDKRLFPEPKPRCQTFRDKKVYFLSARVHPGETPSSFVYKGFIEFLLRENDERSVKLRKRFVFKIIPMLNPDGVKCGHYRTNLEGINLNRMYMGIPDFEKYPSIYAVKSLLIYYHFMNRMDPNGKFNYINALSKYTHLSKFSKCLAHFTQPNLPAVKSNGSNASMITNNEKGTTDFTESSKSLNVCEKSNGVSFFHQLDFTKNGSKNLISVNTDFKDINIDTLYNLNKPCSGIAFYFDLHAHASKRGCFFYGNHFETEDEQVDNILFAKLMALNTPHFDFNASNFSFKNMYMKDSNRMSSKEGSGRVSICKTFGLINRDIESY
ncbi:ATP/GTP-binding protein-like 5 [Intoshia linei]|uniref:Cytosolic carboxypeptidase-like protein 5 n=1 Tax=Intoshia linei TaxID=1819745 RepID=A0A177B6F3_9BILA|nr:ATP/GTP-binding protein-like 5 [Intoshia linei]